MSEADRIPSSTLKRPTTNDQDLWKAYWREQSWLWRTEPEIDLERQKFLSERLAIEPDVKNGIYPFKDIKLTRADIEWLLVTHEEGLGPVNWSDEHQRERLGLDLRGADLRQVDLRNLPLARLEGADLRYAFLDKASNLEGCSLGDTKFGFVSLADVHWGDVNLAVVNWRRLKILGDETKAREREAHVGARTARQKGKRLKEYQAAVRANRQLANAIRAQGMNEEAIPFAYRAQILQRKVYWRQVLWR